MGTGIVDITVSTATGNNPLQKIEEVKDQLESKVPNQLTEDAGKNKIEDVDFSELTKNVTEIVHNLGTKIQFSYDSRSINPVIHVRDEETGELIRQIPREEMLDLLSKLKKIAGIIFQGKV